MPKESDLQEQSRTLLRSLREAMAKATSILEASERAADLTRQILAYSGKGRSILRRFSVSDAIRQIDSLIRSACPEGVVLEMDLPDDLPKIDADPAQIQQMAINLVTNAAEAIAPESGTVRIRTEPRGNHVCIEVRDTRRGMSAKTQEKMFDPFYTTKFIGRGLGLAAVAGIVRSQKGSIQVESAPGNGTVVTILLPAAV